MFHCHACGFTGAKEGFVNEVFQIDDKPVLVEHIPATICSRCGESVFSRETTEKIRRMVHGEAKPEKTISMDVFAFV
ncbi:MAG: YgiT-type zinc finger protein [Nitrospirae bacterium]|nr:YgiT-type zinc finger protein [Nitrospirota bacterium]